MKGREIEEIAQIFGATANTVSKRLQRALERLRKILDKRGVVIPAAAIGSMVAGHGPDAAPASLTVTCIKQLDAPSPAIISLAGGVFKGGLFWLKWVAALLLCFGGVGAAIAIVETSRSNAPTTQPVALVTIASPLSGPLEPVSDWQRRQTRAAIYVIRHNDIELTAAWMEAIRRLVQIGRPAVPDLAAELDRTSAQFKGIGLDTGPGDQELRSLAFTLRAIDDPRTCPALIRAIGRTSVMSSDVVITPAIFNIPPDLVAFMRKYEMEHNRGFIVRGRSIREICSALEKITGHREGDPGSIDARAFTQIEFENAKRRHEALSRQWLRWWDLHHAQIVSDVDLKTLTDHPQTDAEIEAAAADVDENGIGATQPSP